MIYKNTSVKRVIAKVLTDLDLKEGDHRISDMIEWAGEALEKIGAFPSLITKVLGKGGDHLLEIEDYQAKLPMDFHSLIQVAYSTAQAGPFYPMRSSTGAFDHGDSIDVTPENTDVSDVTSTSALIALAMALYDETYEEALVRVNSDEATRIMLNALIVDSGRLPVPDGVLNTTYDYTYFIKPGYIQTNIRDGYLMVSYKAMPTDDDGYPMIPDDASFMEAIYWYITMKLLYPEWKLGRVRDAVYYDARRSWNYYRKQAYGNAMMPDADQMESIKNTWLRLVPEIDEHNTGFSTLGQKQIIYNKSK